MTTRNLLNAIKSLAGITTLAVGLATLGSVPASAQSITPTERMLIFNTAGAVGRMMDVSLPGTAVFMFTPNVSQARLLWTFTSETLTYVQDGWTKSKVGYKIASVSDSNEVLGLPQNGTWVDAVVREVRDPSLSGLRPADRWELVRVYNLPFYQLRNVWNSDVCLTQSSPIVILGFCNANDSRQWFSLMNSMGALK